MATILHNIERIKHFKTKIFKKLKYLDLKRFHPLDALQKRCRCTHNNLLFSFL